MVSSEVIENSLKQSTNMEVEWLILADAAQVLGGKLYMMGGGWDRLTVNQPLPIIRPAAVAVAVSVPWGQTNRRHDLRLEMETIDGEIAATVDANFEVGRPAGIKAGYTQRVQLALQFNFELKAFGEFVIRASLNGIERKGGSYCVIPGPRIYGQQQVPPKKG